ncbi:MAG: cell division protein FtsQ/DivIB [Rhodobacteraceae bacterium]|nr:cell division protein FtsQ/DivIB [Paracoccaceae bacterium]
MRAVVPYADPSPSLLRYRFERLWLKRSVRQLVRLWLPLIVAGTVIFSVSNNYTIREIFQTKSTQMYEAVSARPELQVTKVVFPDVSDDLQQQILTVTGLKFPISSMKLDVGALKRAVETLDAVETAQVRVLGGGALEILTVERDPIMVWRDGDVLRLIDNEGRRVADIARRSARVDLPLIVGLGADLEVAEAMNLIRVAAPISDRVRGLVRIGERRWNLVLDRGQTIMLPEFGAVSALRRVIGLHQAEDLLNRDVLSVDMRNSNRPILRLTDKAISELRRLRTEVKGEDA